jgi:hypothetical protein
MVLGPHLGNWEVLGLHVATLGKAVALYEPPHMKALEDMVRSARQRSGSTLVPTTPRGLTQLVRALRDGGIAGILPDQVPPVVESGENSVFMGVACFTMTLASKLLARSGARAFFGFAERIPGGFRVHYLPADEALYSDDVAESLRALNDGVERCLRHCPEQYQWEYKRFRTRPRGELDYYAPGSEHTPPTQAKHGEKHHVRGQTHRRLLGLLVAGIPRAAVRLVLGHLFDRGLASGLGLGGAALETVREEFFRVTSSSWAIVAKCDGRVSEEEVAHTENAVPPARPR